MIGYFKHMPFRVVNYYCKKLVAMFDSKSTELPRSLAIKGGCSPGSSTTVLSYGHKLCGNAKTGQP